MTEQVLSSLTQARAVFRKHCREQKKTGRRKAPEAWLTLANNSLAVVVYGHNTEDSPCVIAYEYRLGFNCAGIHEITEPPGNGLGNRKKNGGWRPEPLAKPMRQLHMFKAG